MTPEQAELSARRESNLYALSEKQREIIKDCNLLIERKDGGERVITGTVGENEIEIKYFHKKNGPQFEEAVWAKVDGESASEGDAQKLLERYYNIADFQTKEATNLSRMDAEMSGKWNLREKLAKLLS